MSRVEGYELRAAPAVADPERAAADFLKLLPALRPAIGEAALRTRLDGAGRLIRWRSYRAALILDESPVGPAHVKIYGVRNALEILIETAASSRGSTSWRMGRALFDAGLPTPEPMLLLTRKPFRVHRESVLVTRRVDDAVLLTAELKARSAAGLTKRSLIAEVARLAADFHGAGFFHGDFTARNLLVTGPPQKRALWLIDLDRTKRLRWLPERLRRRIQMLDLRLLLLTTAAELSRHGWLRLMLIYFRRAGIPRGSRRDALTRAVLGARRGRVRIGARKPAPGGDPWSGAAAK